MENIYNKEKIRKLNELLSFVDSQEFQSLTKEKDVSKDILKEAILDKLDEKRNKGRNIELSDINDLSGGVQSAVVFLDSIIQHADNIKTILKYNKRQEFMEKELEEKNLKTLGKKLKYTRERLNLSQKDFAGILDVVPSLISQIESDVNRPSYSLMIRIAKGFNIDLNWLLLEDNDYIEYLKNTFNQSFMANKSISDLKTECSELLTKSRHLEEEVFALKLQNNKLKQDLLKKQ